MASLTMRGMVQIPQAPMWSKQALRGDYARATHDYRLPQEWERYTPAEHDIWRTLHERQLALVEAHAAPEFLSGVRLLEARTDQIPRMEAASAMLHRLTGWELVGVPGLIPEQRFFGFLSDRQFPVTVWMRRPDELDYLVEPDLFHDFFGHLPMLTHPVFANYVQEYGKKGRDATSPLALKMLARLYWYTVEFGLINTPRGVRAYGAGILSSSGETVYALQSPEPLRVPFDLDRVLHAEYLIDAYQQQYFVLDSFEQLFDSVLGADIEVIARAAA